MRLIFAVADFLSIFLGHINATKNHDIIGVKTKNRKAEININ